MKKVLLVISALILFSCGSGDEPAPNTQYGRAPVQNNDWRCGTYNGKALYTGPEGGCYYINSSGNKQYVDRSNCNC